MAYVPEWVTGARTARNRLIKRKPPVFDADVLALMVATRRALAALERAVEGMGHREDCHIQPLVGDWRKPGECTCDLDACKAAAYGDDDV